MSDGLQAGLLDRRQRGRGQRPRGEPVGLLALHPDVVLAAGDGLGRGRALRATGRQPDHVGALRLGRHLDAESAAGLVGRRQDDRPGPVAEQDAGVAVGVVEEAGEQLGTDDQDVLRHPARDVGVGRGVRVDEPRAGRGDVHRGRSRVADGLLDQGRRRRHPVVGGERREQDEVDLVGLDAGRPDRAHRGDGGHRGRRLVGRGDPALADPRPRHDPFVGGVDHPLEVVVGQDLRRGVAAPAGDMGGPDRRAHSGSTSMSGCLALTRAPLSGTTRIDAPGQVRLDLVEQLHGLDQADDLADRDLAADLDVRRRPRRRRRVEDPGQRRLDRWPADGPGSRPAVDGSPAVGGASAVDVERAGAPRPPPRPVATSDRLAQDEPGPARLDLELGQVGALEQARQPVDEFEQFEIAAVARLRRRAASPTSSVIPGGP